MLFCIAIEKKVLILLKIHKWFWKAVANQYDGNEVTVKQIGPNMVKHQCNLMLFCSALEKKVLIFL